MKTNVKAFHLYGAREGFHFRGFTIEPRHKKSILMQGSDQPENFSSLAIRY